MDSPTNQPVEPSGSSSPSPAAKTPELARYVRAMIKAGASDLHIKPGMLPHIRVRTEISAARAEPLSPEQTEAMAYELMSPKQRAFFEEQGSVDLAYELAGSDRFRVNAFRQRGKIAIAVRRVTREIPDFTALHLPAILEKIADQHQGLVLLAGTAGSGKSTTVAAMLEHINKTRRCHILTIEDPIEYLYEGKKSLISQREIGIDVPDFEAGLRYLTREDPDVVLIGEMRDRETFQAGLQASETGHLVLGTIHSSTSAQTITRLLDLFPTDGRALIRQSLAFNLYAIVCQKLLPSVAKGVDRVPAVEVLLTNTIVQQLIEEERDGEIPDLIRAHEGEGMQSFTRSLLDLIERNLVDPRVAYEVAPNVDELKMLMKGITASRSSLLGR